MSVLERSLTPARRFDHPALAWLENPAAYGAMVPIVTLAGAGTTLIAPLLLDPVAFGAFALLTTLFQYVSSADLGLSQIVDRRLAIEGVRGGDDVLAARWRLALWLAAGATPLAMGAAWVAGWPIAAAALAVLAGAAFMAGNGRVCDHRAATRVGLFTITALALHFGLTLPRLAGLAFGGVTGCFALMALWYGALALLIARPRGRPPVAHEPLGPMLRAGLPLFAFNGLWLVTLSAARWGSFAVSADEARFGLFAFALNFIIVGAGVVGTVSQVWYPRLLAGLLADRSTATRRIARDTTSLTLAAGLGSAIAAVVAALLVSRFFPHFAAAGPALALAAAAAAPVAVTAWTMALSIALARRPWRDALFVFAGPLALLVPAMALGEHVAGIEGQAVAFVIDACCLVALQCAMLNRVGALTGAGARRCGALAIGLALLVMAGASAARAQDAPRFERPPESALTFRDDFASLRLWSRTGGVWQPVFPWGGRTIAENAERQFYVDPRIDPPALARLDPFSTGKGLAITARPIAPADRSAARGLAYASGLLTSARSFSQTYGYFEVRARLPRGRGLWPAFWLAPTDRSWPPELDVVEAHGDSLDGYWGTVHFGSAQAARETQFRIVTPDLSADFHDFGLEWRPDRLSWVFDNRVVATTPAPPDLTKPMYLILDLAVGGTWPGDPDASTPFPARLEVQRVLAYRLTDRPTEPTQ